MPDLTEGCDAVQNHHEFAAMGYAVQICETPALGPASEDRHGVPQGDTKPAVLRSALRGGWRYLYRSADDLT